VISIEEARAHISSCVAALEARRVPIEQALGCVAATDVIATEAIPGFDNSSMDGFALRADDTSEHGAQLRIIDVVLAGSTSTRTIEPGEATRIMTGAPLPPGADAVEMVEEVSVDPTTATVTVRRRVTRGTFVRHRGDDVAVGDVLVRRGEVLTDARIGVLASQGLVEVEAIPRPRVGVLSTGDELTDAGDPLAPGAIRDVNRPMLMALVRDAGMDPVDLGAVRDRHDETLAAISSAAATCDAVLTTGGVSMGDVDFVKVAIGELGGPEARSLQIAMRPGKPMAFGCVGERRVPVFGLPGNPVSTKVSFEVLARPALLARAGRTVSDRLTVPAIADVPLSRERDGKTHMVHVDLGLGPDGRFHIREARREGSHLLHAVASANAIAVIPDGEGARAGDEVRVMVLRPDDVVTRAPRDG